MYTVTSVFTSDYRIKGSKFLGFLCPTANEVEIGEHLETLQKKHHTATHHCYAYLMNPNEPVEFSTDDGEPGGTAGLPILNTIKSNNLMNVLLIVIRYYGGTKLGKSGLIDAYQTTAQQTILSATLKRLIPVKKYRLKYDYSQQSLIDTWKNSFSLIELDSSYREEVTLTLGCAVEQADAFEKTLFSHEHLFKKVESFKTSFFVEN